jgi:GABA(A) receptor-associated protein
MPLIGKSKTPETPDFDSKHTFEERKKEVDKIMQKWKDRVPVIVERAESAKNTLPGIDKKKYLVPDVMTWAQFIFVVRKRIKLAPEQSLYLHVNNVIPPTSMTLAQIYNEHKSPDGFLKTVYTSTDSFGEQDFEEL